MKLQYYQVKFASVLIVLETFTYGNVPLELHAFKL